MELEAETAKLPPGLFFLFFWDLSSPPIREFFSLVRLIKPGNPSITGRGERESLDNLAKPGVGGVAAGPYSDDFILGK